MLSNHVRVATEIVIRVIALIVFIRYISLDTKRKSNLPAPKWARLLRLNCACDMRRLMRSKVDGRVPEPIPAECSHSVCIRNNIIYMEALKCFDGDTSSKRH